MGYMIVDDWGRVLLGLCSRPFLATLEAVEQFALGIR
jgi:hypothetical protein